MLEQVIDGALYNSLHCPYCDRDLEVDDEDETARITDAAWHYLHT